MAHASVKRTMASALPLWSQPSEKWSVGKQVSADVVPAGARAVAPLYSQAGATIVWYNRGSRGDAFGLRVGDAVSVLVSGDTGRTAVKVAERSHCTNERVACFRVAALLCVHPSLPGAVVQVYAQSEAGGYVYELRQEPFLFLKLRSNVRRALAVHHCGGHCLAEEMSGLTHNEQNEWVVLGRSRGYPSRPS